MARDATTDQAGISAGSGVCEMRKGYRLALAMTALSLCSNSALLAGESSNARAASISSRSAESQAAIRNLPREEVNELLGTIGMPSDDNNAGKSKRRTCIDNGGSWVTNSHGSFCFEKRSIAAKIAAENASPLPMRVGAGGVVDTGPQSWVWLERRRCVRSGGVFWENSGGTFCMKPLSMS